MTIAAATDDPRFPKVKAIEIAHLSIEINALTPLTPILPQEIEIGRHGMMVINGDRAGLLLPEVAVRYNWNTETYLRALCRKAGLLENVWTSRETKLFGFEAEAWGEE